MLVTAFGPFANIKENPSEVLARAILGHEVRILPVSFSAVDKLLNELPPTERLLMLGVGRGDRGMRIERVASDYIGEHKDVSGESRQRSRSEELRGSLLADIGRCDCWDVSQDGGGYLCNYVYYEATKKYPNTATGFVHVPPFSIVPFPVQLVRLKRLINLISL